MKVKFYFREEPITWCKGNEISEITKVNRAIIEKVQNKIIDIPCLPTKEMQVDICSFHDIFGFTTNEMEWIDDCFYHVTNIMIRPDYLEVWLDEENP